MLCSICGHRDAVVFLKEFDTGKIVYPLCKECYEEVRNIFNKKIEYILLTGEEDEK